MKTSKIAAELGSLKAALSSVAASKEALREIPQCKAHVQMTLSEVVNKLEEITILIEGVFEIGNQGKPRAIIDVSTNKH